MVARYLRRRVRGRRVSRVEVRDRSVVRSPSPRVFAHRLRGRTVLTVGRRGKYLIFFLSGGFAMVGHLRMTGNFVVVPRRSLVRLHTRLVMGFGPDELRFVDQRRFGHVDLVSVAGLEAFPGLRTLGVEPLTASFSPDRLRDLIGGRRGTLKPFLLRQDLIAGIGNIYADEILFQARLHPARALGTLRPRQLEALYRSIRTVLRRGIAARSRRGAAEGDLIAVREKRGRCPRCGGSIRTATVGGRTTYFCPRCQR